VLVTHRAAYSNVEETPSVSARPANGPGAPRPWGRLPGEPQHRLLRRALEARAADYHASIVAGTVLGDELVWRFSARAGPGLTATPWR
jgi:hypothetical protein